MNKAIYLTIALLGLTACSGNNTNGSKQESQMQASTNGKKFAPQERKSKFSEEERQAAIAAKRASLSLDPEIAFGSRSIKLSILPPTPEGDITEDVSIQIAQKMLSILSENGISGIGNAPNLVLGIKASQTGRESTGTVPQKMIVKYNLSYQVMNLASGDIYASQGQEVLGVGRSFEEAASNLAEGITNSPDLQQMLKIAEERILDFYSKNLQTVKNQVQDAVKRKNFDLAIALLHSIPEQAKDAFQYATQKLPEVFELMKRSHAADELAALQTAISVSDEAIFNPEVACHMQMIPSDMPEYAKAEALVKAYQTKIEARRKEIEAKAAEDEAYRRKLEELSIIHAHETELAQIETDKVIAKYEAQASSKHSRELLDASRGFWGNLGDRIIHGVDFVGNFITGED